MKTSTKYFCSISLLTLTALAIWHYSSPRHPKVDSSPAAVAVSPATPIAQESQPVLPKASVVPKVQTAHGPMVKNDEQEFPGIDAAEVAKIREIESGIREEVYNVYAEHAKIAKATPNIVVVEVQLPAPLADQLDRRFREALNRGLKPETLSQLQAQNYLKNLRTQFEQFARTPVRYEFSPGGEGFAKSATFGLKTDVSAEIPDHPEFGLVKVTTDGAWTEEGLYRSYAGLARLAVNAGMKATP